MNINSFKKLKGVQLLAYSGAFFITIFLAFGLFTFSREAISRLLGQMTTVTLPIEEFERIALIETPEGEMLSTDSDSQLLLTRDMKVSRVSFKAEYSVHPGEITLYYTTKPGQGFAPTKRYWFFPSEKAQNQYEASFGLKSIKSIRIDPTTEAGNRIKISEITFNPPKSFLSFFSVGYSEIFKLLVYTCILASSLAFVQEIVIKKSK